LLGRVDELLDLIRGQDTLRRLVTNLLALFLRDLLHRVRRKNTLIDGLRKDPGHHAHCSSHRPTLQGIAVGLAVLLQVEDEGRDVVG
jgi:hypothetical protein